MSKADPLTNDAAESKPTTQLARPSVDSAKPTLTTNAPVTAQEANAGSTERQTVSPARVDGIGGSNPQVSTDSLGSGIAGDPTANVDVSVRTNTIVAAIKESPVPSQANQLLVDHLCVIDRQLVIHGIVVTSREALELPFRVRADIVKRLASQAEIAREIDLVKAMYIHGKNQAPSAFRERCKLYLREDIE